MSLRFGTNNNVGTTYYSYPLGCGDVSSDVYLDQSWVADVGEMVVNWPLHYPAGKKVLLTIEGVDYTRIAGEAFNGSNVTLKVGETTYHPLVITNAACGYGYDLSYWVKVSGSSFTLSGATFTWPNSSTNYDTVGDSSACRSVTGSVQENYHHLSFRGFHNCTPDIIIPRGAPVSDNRGKGWNSVNARFDFQGVTISAVNPYGLFVRASNCSECGYQWDIDSWIGWDGKQNTPTPTINPPSVDVGESTPGEIRLAFSPNKKVIMYRDHLARDVDNFRCGKQCEPGQWETPYGKTTYMQAMECYESVDHACLGMRNDKEDPVGLETHLINEGKWTRTAGEVFDYPFTGAGIVATNKLKRGDVVFLYTYACDNNRIQHSVVVSATGGKVWAANNGYPFSSPMIFNELSLADLMNMYTNYWNPCKIRIRILKAPATFN